MKDLRNTFIRFQEKMKHSLRKEISLSFRLRREIRFSRVQSYHLGRIVRIVEARQDSLLLREVIQDKAHLLILCSLIKMVILFMRDFTERLTRKISSWSSMMSWSREMNLETVLLSQIHQFKHQQVKVREESKERTLTFTKDCQSQLRNLIQNWCNSRKSKRNWRIVHLSQRLT